MKREEIMMVIAELAKSQGYYGRLYRYLLSIKKYDKILYNDYMEKLETENFNNVLDFILFMEG